MEKKQLLLTVALATLTALSGLPVTPQHASSPNAKSEVAPGSNPGHLSVSLEEGKMVGSIECEDEEGPAKDSFYADHTFYLDLPENNGEATSYEWVYFLKDTAGEWQQVSASSDPTLTIQPLETVEGYYVDADKAVEGKVECAYTVGNESYSAEPLLLALDLKPVILSIEDVELDRDKYDFTVSFTVNYLGSDKVEVGIDEEYVPVGITKIFREPLTAHCTTPSIISLYWSWVTITVTNEYGRVSHTMEYPPYDPTEVETSVQGMSATQGSVKVFNAHGTLLYEGPATDFSPDSLAPGIYLKLEETGEGNTITTKFLKQ